MKCTGFQLAKFYFQITVHHYFQVNISLPRTTEPMCSSCKFSQPQVAVTYILSHSNLKKNIDGIMESIVR